MAKDEEAWLTDTEQQDSWTEDAISYGDDIVAIVPVWVRQTPEGVLYQFKTTEDGADLAYDVNFVATTSWAEMEEQLTGALEDNGETPYETPAPIASCNICNGGIADGEVAILLKRGEIHRSPCTPNGEYGRQTFVPHGHQQQLLCLGCGSVMHDYVISLWNDPIQQHEECAEGTKLRCWRQGCGSTKSTCMQRHQQ